ncbi:MAG: protein kinase [candidate division Zixibacteria bacterium]|nr:protein kinase [candidate division Zixibacteria bacterium]
MAADESHDDRTQSFVALTKGTDVSHYKIIEKIGAGGMGEVYLAEDTELDRKVALKFLSSHLCQDEDCRARFKREAQAVAKLNHPNIVTIFEVAEHNGRPFFAMEHVEGQSVREFSSDEDLPIERILDLGIQICEGLQDAHEKGVTHRDIKLSNILIDSHGRAKIVDFGLASVVGSDQLTKTGSTLGTIGYMSPEQVQGKEIDHRSDLFSLGVVLYELITKQNPFKRDIEAATLKAVCDDMVHPLARYRSDIPEGLQGVIERVLEKHVETRYQSAADLASDIKRVSIKGSSSTSATKQHQSIAVLPFVDMSPEKDQEYFCDGIAEELINGLTQLSGLKVAARTSAFQFKQPDRDIPTIGRELGVTTVLEGSVRKAGNRLRITAQLVSVKDGFHLWSEKYDRTLDDVFAIQDEISLAIVDKLKVRLLGEERSALIKRHTDDQEAHNLYLKGLYFWNRRLEGGMKLAMEHFHQAIEKDPDYALAHVGVADTYNISGFFGFFPPKEAFPRAFTAAKKALEIDDKLGEAHASLAWFYTFHEWDWSAAESEFKRAIELNPNYATAHEWYGVYLIAMGRFDEAIAETERARVLDPLSLIINAVVGVAYYFARRYEESIKNQQKTLDLDPNFLLANTWIVLAYVANGMCESVVKTIRRVEASAVEHAYSLGYFGFACGVCGQEEDALRTLDILNELAKKRYVSPVHQANVLLGLGRMDEAFDLLEKAYVERNPMLVFIGTGPFFDPILSNTRYVELLRKIGL